MANRKPLPKTQKQLSQDSITPYRVENFAAQKTNVDNLKKREFQRTVKDDDVKNLTIGLKDIDEAIFYYFKNVIRPSVIQNGVQKEVPVIYGSPERWATVQREGYLRDKNGKMQLPLIVVKRDSVEKNRQFGNKMDANNPNNFGIFEKRFSNKNIYDRFSSLNNRKEVKEYHGVVIPDYVNITYSCIIFTEYIEQMNKVIESVNYASDAYWGDPEKFNFRAMIDSYSTATTLNQGEDRVTKTDFTIKLLGHIIPDAINTLQMGSRKFFSKSSVTFGLETVADINTVQSTGTITGDDKASYTFKSEGKQEIGINPQGAGMTQTEKTYVTLMRSYSSNTTTVNISNSPDTMVWVGLTIATPPPGFAALTKHDFQVFINGLLVESDAIDSITQTGSDITVILNSDVNYDLSSDDELMIIGKITA